MRAPLLVCLALAACSGAASGGPGAVEGTVVSVDLSPWAVDGDGRLVVATGDGDVTVRVPARADLCRAAGLDAVGEVAPGDRVEVRGERAGGGDVTPCQSADHYVRRVAPLAVRGLYEQSFEVSSFRPCGRSETWWLALDSAAAARYEAVRRETGQRAPQVLVAADVAVSGRGRHGHLGAYDRTASVRRLVSMEPADGVASCR